MPNTPFQSVFIVHAAVIVHVVKLTNREPTDELPCTQITQITA